MPGCYFQGRVVSAASAHGGGGGGGTRTPYISENDIPWYVLRMCHFRVTFPSFVTVRRPPPAPPPPVPAPSMIRATDLFPDTLSDIKPLRLLACPHHRHTPPSALQQFDDVHEDRVTGGTRGVVTELRGLRHLSRITSRKKHADLIVFHFKSRSGSGSATAAAASGSRAAAGAAAAGHGASSSSSSRRSRTKPSSEREPAAGQPDVLFYFMRDHAECLRMVKDNYRKVTQGSGGGDSSSKPAAAAASGSTPSLSVRRGAGGGGGGARGDSSRTTGDSTRKTTRQTARAAAGAAAGAAGIVVGAAAGMAVGAAAGVAVGAAFLAGHRKGSHAEDNKTKSNSPSRFRKRGGSEGPGGALADADLVNNGWIPIDAPRGERRRADASGGGGGGVVRPASAGGAVSSRRPSSTSTASNESRGHGRSRGAGSADATSADRTATGGPRWLGQG